MIVIYDRNSFIIQATGWHKHSSLIVRVEGDEEEKKFFKLTNGGYKSESAAYPPKSMTDFMLGVLKKGLCLMALDKETGKVPCRSYGTFVIFVICVVVQ
jgi:hypothetical protein